MNNAKTANMDDNNERIRSSTLMFLSKNSIPRIIKTIRKTTKYIKYPNLVIMRLFKRFHSKFEILHLQHLLQQPLQQQQPHKQLDQLQEQHLQLQ